MKWFWMIMAVLVVVTGVLIARRGGGPAPVEMPEMAVSAPPAERVEEPAPAPVEEEKKVESEKAEVPAPEAIAPAVQQEAPVELVTKDAVPDVVPGPAPKTEEQPAATGAPAPEVVQSTVEASSAEAAGARAPGSLDTEAKEPVAAAPSEEKPESLAGASGSDEAKPVMFRDQFEVVPARTKPGENGFTIYDERFPVKGTGTPADPLEISWDYLVSASETFQPRMGKKRLPERITMLDKKHVRVTGYVAFPIMAASQNEMLSMRNMWDGCCIGVPPTPYDAIEVKLKEAATGRDRFTAFGTIEGVMQVDPYIKGNWLLGLYLMEGATLSQLKEGGDPGKHGGM